MLRFRERATDLIRVLERAFEDVPCPADLALLRADSDDDLDVRDFYGDIRTRDWRTIPSDFLEEHYGSLSAFSPAALHFYLPAYLKRALEGEVIAPGSPILPAVLCTLTPSRHNTWRIRDLAHSLTDEQAAVVLAFLELVRDDHEETCLRVDARSAIELFWERTQPGGH